MLPLISISSFVGVVCGTKLANRLTRPPTESRRSKKKVKSPGSSAASLWYVIVMVPTVIGASGRVIMSALVSDDAAELKEFLD
jgi:hypothetical protein